MQKYFNLKCFDRKENLPFEEMVSLHEDLVFFFDLTVCVGKAFGINYKMSIVIIPSCIANYIHIYLLYDFDLQNKACEGDVAARNLRDVAIAKIK